MKQFVNEDKQKGSISLFGALSIIMGITALVGIMELANAKILDRNLDNYAKSLAPVALQSEMALSKKMGYSPFMKSVGFLAPRTPPGTRLSASL